MFHCAKLNRFGGAPPSCQSHRRSLRPFRCTFAVSSQPGGAPGHAEMQTTGRVYLEMGYSMVYTPRYSHVHGENMENIMMNHMVFSWFLWVFPIWVSPKKFKQPIPTAVFTRHPSPRHGSEKVSGAVSAELVCKKEVAAPASQGLGLCSQLGGMGISSYNYLKSRLLHSPSPIYRLPSRMPRLLEMERFNDLH